MPDRHFSARAATEGRQHAFDVTGPDFETAALEFVDRWHPAPDEAGEVEYAHDGVRTTPRIVRADRNGAANGDAHVALGR